MRKAIVAMGTAAIVTVGGPAWACGGLIAPNGAVGLVVTKTLVIMGDPQVTTAQGRSRGAMLRAYDKATGKEVGAVYMPAQQSGSPMTYMLNGKQYIVVAVSGGAYSGEYIAFALPDDERPARSSERR